MLFFCTAAFLPPVTAGVISYSGILVILMKRRHRSPSPSIRVKRSVVEKKENIIASVSVLICLLQMICLNVPTVVIGLGYWAGYQLKVPPAVALLFHIVWYAKSCTNPLIFGFLNKAFRSEIVRMWGQWCGCKKGKEWVDRASTYHSERRNTGIRNTTFTIKNNEAQE